MLKLQTGRKLLAGGALAVLLSLVSAVGAQQTGAQANRVLGTVTSITGNTLAVKTDAGAAVSVTVPETARIIRTAPGQKTLAGAEKIALTDIAEGDRVLMLVAGDPPAAKLIVVNKKADLAARQQQEQEDWQRRGVGGIVKSIDSAAGTVTIASGARTVAVHTTPQTVIRRYAPNSVKFSDAQTSTLAAIQPGDQLEARGDKSADGAQITAEEIVSGSFRNIAGMVLSVDASAGTFKVRDLATKKEVTVHTTADSDLRKLDPQMAQMIAARLKANGAGQAHGAAEGRHPGMAREAGGQAPAEAQNHPGASGRLAQVLRQSPEIHIGDLHKGDAVMIVATSGSPDQATAIRLVTGVEPMLEASASGSQNMFSSAWSLGGGSGGDQGDQGSQQ